MPHAVATTRKNLKPNLFELCNIKTHKQTAYVYNIKIQITEYYNDYVYKPGTRYVVFKSHKLREL